jgi:hypothetical protein
MTSLGQREKQKNRTQPQKNGTSRTSQICQLSKLTFDISHASESQDLHRSYIGHR